MVEKISSERAATYRLAEQISKKPALVFLKGFLGNELILAPEDTARNDPFFRDSVIYATDQDARNKELIRFYPNHHVYLAYYDRGHRLPILKPITPELSKK